MNYFKQLKIVAVLSVVAALVVIVNVAFAGVYVASSPSQQDPNPFLDTSASLQSKQGWLALGQVSANPLGSLDVAGTAITDALSVTGNAWSNGKISVGTGVVPISTDPSLVVGGLSLRASSLAGTGDRQVCADSTGKFTICSGTAIVPVNGMCGTAGSAPASVMPTSGLCATGTASTVSGTGPWNWTCAGSGGGSTAPCNDVLLGPPVNAECGTFAYGEPISDLCTQGTLSGTITLGSGNPYYSYPAGDSPVSIAGWECVGSNGGSSATCNNNFCPDGSSLSTGCFLPGTKVTMADGSTKNIESVTLGESLLTTDGGSNTVKSLIHHPFTGWVYGINGSKPFVTADHPMMTPDGWKSFDPAMSAITEPGVTIVGTLKIGDYLIDQNGKSEKITSLSKEFENNVTVYNFNVSGNDEYYAGGYEVHNAQNTGFPVCETGGGGGAVTTPQICGSTVGTCTNGTASSTQLYVCSVVFGTSTAGNGSGEGWTCTYQGATTSCGFNPINDCNI